MYKCLDIRLFPYMGGTYFHEGETRIISEFKNEYKGCFDFAKRTNAHTFDFRLNGRKADLTEAISYLKERDSKIGMSVFAEDVYEKEDFDNAVAYFLKFKDLYDEYYSERYGIKKQFYPPGRFCEDWYYEEKRYGKPTKKVEKKFSESESGASLRSSDKDGISVISDQMYEYVIDNGIESKYFQPMLKGSGEQWGWALNPTVNILPSFSVVSSQSWGYILSSCYQVNSIHFNLLSFEDEEKEEPIYDEEEFEKNRFALDVHGCLEPNIWTIDEKGLNSLKPVNLLGDTDGIERESVINKELFELFASKDQSIYDYSTPVFLDNRPLEQRLIKVSEYKEPEAGKRADGDDVPALQEVKNLNDNEPPVPYGGGFYGDEAPNSFKRYRMERDRIIEEFKANGDYQYLEEEIDALAEKYSDDYDVNMNFCYRGEKLIELGYYREGIITLRAAYNHFEDLANMTSVYLRLADDAFEQGKNDEGKEILIKFCNEGPENYEDSVEFAGLGDVWNKHKEKVAELVRKSM